MARDYKRRIRSRYDINQNRQSVSWWKWLLIIALLAAFGSALYWLKNRTASPAEEPGLQKQKALALPQAGKLKPIKKPAQNKETGKGADKEAAQEKPKFDFYTILPEKEVVIPDHEIKTRTREEQVGKAKKTQYIIQAGSFRNYKDADRLKAQLALMGIESKIEKATVGNAIWNRIKIGPFTKMASVNDIRSRLRKNKIDVVVMEKH